jgi:putative methyltransferase
MVQLQSAEPTQDRSSRRPRILISEPSASESPFLPYMTGILKSYWEHFGSDPKAFEWMEPLWIREQAKGDLDKLYFETPDVLGLSCYTWNWDLQCKVARWAKARNPDCLVVAGGPDPDYKDPAFFRKHPYIDIVVVKDGEIPFREILETYLAGNRDFRHIHGLYLPAPAAGLQILGETPHLFTGPADVPTEFPYSPYLEQADMYERLRREQKGLWIHATLETNRGCPYTCSYCDWGSSTMSKLRRFEMERVEAEIDWFGRIGVDFLFLADANFGILPRDLDIADRLGEMRAKYSKPIGMYYSAAKNNPDRVVEVARKAHEYGLVGDHVLAIQHTDEGVLAGTARSNISPAKYREVVAKLSTYGIACETQLILGIPGDTPEKWKNCLAELMSWGVHDNYQASPYALLPNAPAAEPAFQAKWQMRTVDRCLVYYGGFQEKNRGTDIKSRIVVGWKDYTEQDWIEQIMYTVFVRSYHNRSLTRLPAIYLYFVHGVSYREYYDAIIDEFSKHSPVVEPLYREIRKLYEQFLHDPEVSDVMDLDDDFPEATFVVDPVKWLTIKTCLRLDEFYAALSDFLVKRFPQAANLRSVINYQKQLIVMPDYDHNQGKSFLLHHDWPSFFHATKGVMEHRQMDEPTAFLVPRHAALAEADRIGRNRFLDFGNGTPSERTSRWLKQSILVLNSSEYGNLRHPIVASVGVSLYNHARDLTAQAV